MISRNIEDAITFGKLIVLNALTEMQREGDNMNHVSFQELVDIYTCDIHEVDFVNQLASMKNNASEIQKKFK